MFLTLKNSYLIYALIFTCHTATPHHGSFWSLLIWCPLKIGLHFKMTIQKRWLSLNSGQTWQKYIILESGVILGSELTVNKAVLREHGAMYTVFSCNCLLPVSQLLKDLGSTAPAGSTHSRLPSAPMRTMDVWHGAGRTASPTGTQAGVCSITSVLFLESPAPPRTPCWWGSGRGR